MSEFQLTLNQSLSIAILFLEELWKDRSKFFSNLLPTKSYDSLKAITSEKVIFYNPREAQNEPFEERFSIFMSILTGDPGTSEDWENCYKIAFGNDLHDSVRLTQNESFTLLIEFCAKYHYDFGIPNNEILNILFDIRYRPEFHKEEWNLWQKCLRHVLGKQ